MPSKYLKINSNYEKQVILMILNEENKVWHYIAVKKLSVLSLF